VACRVLEVPAHPAAPPRTVGPVVWPAEHSWDRRYENLYAAWIAALFDAPVEASLDFRPLHQALRDPARNFLYGYLGLREDDPKNKAALPATPDCADLPYFLRGYFAWKLRLPFAFRDCDRGTDARPPKCSGFFTNEDAPAGKDPLAAAKSFFRLMSNHVQSGSARTGLDDDATDYYPLPLEREALRPGVIYADPYGHVMMVVRWVDQTPEHGGLLLAVDGQPDTSIGRKRFWEGTFLFNNETKSAGPGFKAFRPVVRGRGLARGAREARLPHHPLPGPGGPASPARTVARGDRRGGPGRPGSPGREPAEPAARRDPLRARPGSGSGRRCGRTDLHLAGPFPSANFRPGTEAARPTTGSRWTSPRARRRWSRRYAPPTRAPSWCSR